jgi:2,4-diaminopentanoate dehydrogenase
MPYKVIQFGTGNSGRHALRAILERPELELIGVRCYDPGKVGIDAGDFVKASPTGVMATDDLDGLLALGADCVSYSALGWLDLPRTMDEICRILEAGVNVASNGTVTMIYPDARPGELRDRLHAACKKGGTTFFEGGCNPGFTMDILPVVLSRMARSIDEIEMTEVVDMSRAYRPAQNSYIGFGLPPGPCGLDEMHADRFTSPYYASFATIADAVGFEIDGFHYERTCSVTEEPLVVATGRIEPGMVAGQHLRLSCTSSGRAVLAMNVIWRMSDGIFPEWELGDWWAVEFKGDPRLRCRYEVTTEMDYKRAVPLMAAMGSVNAIPLVCESPPGVRIALDMPLFGGGRLSPEGRSA